MRDRLTWRLCNFLLNHLATKEYRDRLLVVILYGVAELEARRILEEEAGVAFNRKSGD